MTATRPDLLDELYARSAASFADWELIKEIIDESIDLAMSTPPQTTRARLRGAFIKRAKERKRDYTVDWVHLKLNDQAQRTVLCKDPFRAVDDRVEKLIASM